MKLVVGEEYFILTGRNSVYEQFLKDQGRGIYDPKVLWMGPGPGVEQWAKRLAKWKGKELKVIVVDWNFFSEPEILELMTKVELLGGQFIYWSVK